LQREWGPKILSRKYDSGSKPPAAKNGLTIGVAVAEKRGGSDFGAIRSTAEKVSDAVYRLAGHKWFVSAPMSDAFVMLAQTREGLGCFLVPRILPDGGSNGLHIQRLKETIGHRSNATAEIEFGKTLGYLLGGPDAGSRTMLDMVTLMRLDSALSSCGLMRASVAEAVHFCRNRTAFSKPLIDQPIMTRVLADMALDVAAATALSFRLADAFDRARLSSDDAAYARIMTPVSKYWTCKIAPALIAETIECLGGSGYVEDRPLARHYREAPMNAVWEGPGNMMALDLLRVLNRGRDLFESVLAGIAADLGSGAQKTIDVLRAAMALCQRDEGAARLLIEQLALAAGAAELKRLGAGRIADAFLETRLAGGWRSTYGMLDSRFDAAYIIDLLYPSPV
jgi:putative acyl-CoA dehydrogenase